MAVDFDKIKKYKKYFVEDPRLLNPSESTKINNIYTKEKALKPTQKVDPDRFEIESLFPGIGDAMDLVDIEEAISDKNYGQAALGAGLLLVPNAIEKPVKAGLKVLKNKATPVILNNVVDKIPALRNQYFKRQDKKFLEGMHETFEGHNGSRELLNRNSVNGYSTLQVTEEVKNRAKNAGITYNSRPIGENPYDNIFVYLLNPKSNGADIRNLKNGKYKDYLSVKDDISDAIKDFAALPSDYLGVHFPISHNGNLIMAKRYDSRGNLIPSTQIKGIGAHEASHITDEIYSTNYFNSDYLPNTDTKMGKLSKDVLGHPNPEYNEWAKKPTELKADIWKFRAENNIGARDLTDSEVDKFINKFGYKHFNSSDLNKIRELIKITPIVGGFLMLNGGMNNENNKQTERKAN